DVGTPLVHVRLGRPRRGEFLHEVACAVGVHLERLRAEDPPELHLRVRVEPAADRSNVRPVRQRHSTPSTGGNSGGLSVGISGPTNRTLRREGSSVTVIDGFPVKLV